MPLKSGTHSDTLLLLPLPHWPKQVTQPIPSQWSGELHSTSMGRTAKSHPQGDGYKEGWQIGNKNATYYMWYVHPQLVMRKYICNPTLRIEDCEDTAERLRKMKTEKPTLDLATWRSLVTLAKGISVTLWSEMLNEEIEECLTGERMVTMSIYNSSEKSGCAGRKENT